MLKIYENRDIFEQEIKNGSVDFYFGNPGYGIVGFERHGYIPLIRSNKKLLRGILVTHADSGITSLKQLSGKTIAFPSENAFAASKYLRTQLKNVEKLDFTPAYIGTHDNVYRSVVIGYYPAGGGVERTLSRESDHLKSKLNVIYRTPGTAPHPLMANPMVPVELRKMIQNAILDLDKTEQGRKLLNNLKLQQPVIPDYNKDYTPIGNLVHEMYSHLY